jgi:hypothetical protein
VAEFAGVSVSLLAAAILGLGVGVLVRGLALPESGEALVPSDHMPGHQGMAAPPPGEAGPVLVQVEYRLRRPEDRDALLAALAPLEAVRRRDGASAWHALTDPEDPLRLVEAFLVRDWAEHERMHARATAADTPLHQAANAFDAEGRPHVRHLVGPHPVPVPPAGCPGMPQTSLPRQTTMNGPSARSTAGGPRS